MGLTVVILTITAVAGIASAVRRAHGSAASRYRTETVTRGPVTGVVVLPGLLASTSTVRVGVERHGIVDSVAVKTGDRVTRGQVLARLDARDVKAQASGAAASAIAAEVEARQAEARLGQLVFLLEQRDRLLPRGPQGALGPGVRPGEIEAAAMAAEANFVNAAAQLKKQTSAADTARALVSRSVLRAPIDGVVMSRAVEPGELAAPGAPLFVVAADQSQLDLVTTVAEADVARVESGRAHFTVPAFPERTFTAVVRAVEPAPVGDRAPYRYQVRLRAQNPLLLLRPGMSATVTLDLRSPAEALRVPVEALTFAPTGATGDGTQTSVHVIDQGGRLRRERVEVGVSDGKLTEVRRTAVAPGAMVVVGLR